MAKAPITAPTHPELAALHKRHRKALFWRGADGAEALVFGRRIVACRPRGKLREGVLESPGEIGKTARAVLAGTAVPKRRAGTAETEVYVAYNHAGGVCCWSRDRAVAGRSAKRADGFVKAFIVPAFPDSTGPAFGGRHGIPEHVAPPWRKADHPRGGTTEVQSVLLPKALFPTKRSAITWLRAQPKPFKADRIEDSGKVRPGHYWRARQFDPRRGVRHRIKAFGSEGIKAVIEAKGRRKAAA